MDADTKVDIGEQSVSFAKDAYQTAIFVWTGLDLWLSYEKSSPFPSHHKWSSKFSVHGNRNTGRDGAAPSPQSAPAPKHTTHASQSLSRRLSQGAWVELLDQYLPLELRSKNWLENLAAFEGIRPIYALPPLLIEARASFTLGLLSYVAIEQGRWDAYMWLSKELLSCNVLKESSLETVLREELPEYGMDSLDVLTTKPLVLRPRSDRPLKHQSVSLDQIAEYQEPSGAGIAPDMMRDVVGQLWQSVARLILEATKAELERCNELMSYAHRTIALMHHYQKIPDSMYSNKYSRASPYVRKPPMLELLSSRILTVISDSVWKAEEQAIIAEAALKGAKYVYKGHELPGAEYQPRISRLGTQIWLELVLWSCVESSMIPDAAKVVAEMVKAKGEKRWQVMTWGSLQASTPKDMGGPVVAPSGLIRWWLNSIAGTQEGYKDDTPPIELKERTVSSEVIAAIADGLVSVIREPGSRSGLSSSAVRFHINICKALLDRQTAGSMHTFWNSILLRLIAFDYHSPEALPGVLNRLLDIAPSDAGRPRSTEGGDIEDSADHGGASFGLLHQTLKTYIRLGDINGTLNAFRRLQNWIDATRVQSVREFWRDYESMPEKDQSDERADIAGLEYEIPHSTLAPFLDLITTAKEYDLGKWLLYSDEIDGPVIPPSLYSSHVLQPALLRFASATADSDLMRRVTQSMSLAGETYTEDILRTILHCQMRSGRLKEVDLLLAHLTSERGLLIEAHDMTVLAATVLSFEHSATTAEESQRSLRRAQDLLERVLSGAYQPKRNFSRPRDYSSERQRNQLCRIFASVPGALNTTAQKLVQQSGQSHTPVRIETGAFNVLLDAVVDAFGSQTGKGLYDRWCEIPAERPVSHESPSGDEFQPRDDPMPLVDDRLLASEKVVVPNLATIQIILRPLLHSLKPGEVVSLMSEPDSTQDSQEVNQDVVRDGRKGEEQHAHSWHTIPLPTKTPSPATVKMLLAWGAATYGRLGLSTSEINVAIPGSFPARKRAHKPRTVVKVDA
ncbi:hypothetical protein MMC26_001910 [Xylographa opegraphella]|nr:hypothetical protein [Xylographa opegraphella]